MARTAWLNDNASRSFPFLARTSFVTDATIVDFGCVMDVQSGFIEGVHGVWLASASRTDDTFIFEFQTDAPGCAGSPLRFTRQLNDINLLEYSTAVCVVEGACNTVAWSGYLITGALKALAEVLTAGTTLSGVAPVEPALIRSLVSHYVSSLNAANGDRTRVPADDDCSCSGFVSVSPQDIWTLTTCRTGVIWLQEGYNCVIQQSAIDNSITIGAYVGGGAGEPCEPVSMYPEETPPSDRSLLDGSLGCNEVIRSINGVSGPHVSVIGGPGVTVTSNIPAHQVIIDINFKTMAECVDMQETSESLSMY